MNCQSCLRHEARYRVYTDMMNREVCISCAMKAAELGFAFELLLKSEPIIRMATHPRSLARRSAAVGLRPHGHLPL